MHRDMGRIEPLEVFETEMGVFIDRFVREWSLGDSNSVKSWFESCPLGGEPVPESLF